MSARQAKSLRHVVAGASQLPRLAIACTAGFSSTESVIHPGRWTALAGPLILQGHRAVHQQNLPHLGLKIRIATLQLADIEVLAVQRDVTAHKNVPSQDLLDLLQIVVITGLQLAGNLLVDTKCDVLLGLF